jgi:hypothetical protein
LPIRRECAVKRSGRGHCNVEGGYEDRGSMSELEDIFQRYFATILRLNEIALSRDRSDPMQLTKLRIGLSNLMMAMQTDVPERILARSRAPEALDLVEQHRSKFLAERQRVIQHQANWTAPAMGADCSGYERDVRALFGLHEANHKWRMEVLLPAVRAMKSGV